MEFHPFQVEQIINLSRNIFMSTKLCWTGLAFYTVSGALGLSSGFVLAGAIILAIGVVLMWLDK